MSHFFKQLTSHAISTMLLNKCEDVYSTVHKSVTVIYETFAWNGAQYAKEKCVRWICSQVNIVLFTYSVLWLSSPLLWPEDVRKKKKTGNGPTLIESSSNGGWSRRLHGPRTQTWPAWDIMDGKHLEFSKCNDFIPNKTTTWTDCISFIVLHQCWFFFFSPTVGCCYADCPVAPHWTPRLILPGS